MTWSVLAICGTHLGDTKLPASTAEWPAADRASINFTLASTGTGLASFCKPSRGPTSTSRTRLGRFIVASGWHRAILARTLGKNHGAAAQQSTHRLVQRQVHAGRPGDDSLPRPQLEIWRRRLRHDPHLRGPAVPPEGAYRPL